MRLVEQKISFGFLFKISKELLKGKSLMRTLLNLNLTELILFGEVLDLGSKSDKASYNRFLRKDKNCRITFTDLRQSGNNLIKLDLEERFEIDDEKYDFITCFNVLEHIFDFNNLAEECFRILKKRGAFIGQTPFLVNYHADPNDYFRYTDQAIEKIFTSAGFMREKIVYLGFGPLSASFSLAYRVFPKITRPFFAILAILLDEIIIKIKKTQKFKYPIGYLYIMRKN